MKLWETKFKICYFFFKYINSFLLPFALSIISFINNNQRTKNQIKNDVEIETYWICKMEQIKRILCIFI